MKKSTIALSVAAVIGGLGFMGNAMAIGVLAGATAGSVMKVNTDGIGHQLVVPYFSAQGANATLLNITNTDTVNGKVVKVRFRGAANSDDLFDFTLLLSPGDVWTAAVSQDAATGLPLLKTTDASCALPATVKSATGQTFITGRVDPTPAKGSMINETREGYIEIITMADVPVPAGYAALTAAQKAATLYGTIKHASAVAACDATVLSGALGTDWATIALANTAGMTAPTGLLAADWVILNQANTAAWSGSATALQVTTAAGANTAGNLIFWPQKDNIQNGNVGPLLGVLNTRGGVAANGLMDATSDPLFTSGAVTIQPFDLPDLSTPLAAVNATPEAQADDVGARLAVASVTNGFVTNSGIAGVTDFLFTQPTRRYSVAVNYYAPGTASAANDVLNTGTRGAAVYRGAFAGTAGFGSAYYGSANTALSNRQVCLNSITSPTFFDREESQASTSFVISPGVATAFSLCGEAAVASINAAGVVAGSALSATVVRNDVTFGTGYDLGWATFDTSKGNNLVAKPAAGYTGMPILGSAFVRVANGSVNYGFTTAHKVTR